MGKGRKNGEERQERREGKRKKGGPSHLPPLLTKS